MRGRRVAAALGAAVLTLISACSAEEQPIDLENAASRAHEVKVALVPGGAHPYFQLWRTGGAEAKAAFGIGEVTYDESSGWDQATQNRTINTYTAQGYTAFGVFGVSSVDINATFSNMKSTGLVVASLGSCPADTVNKADFCLATDVEVAAYKAARAAIDAIGGEGALVHLTGNRVDTNTERRMAGVRHAVDETNGKVTLLTTVTDIDKDQASADKAVTDLLASQGRKISGIVTTGYIPALAAANGVAAAKLPIKIVAIDDDKVILDGIRGGSVAATVAQNPVGQAYVGSWALTQLVVGECKNKWRGQIIDSGSFVITKANVDSYDAERKAKTQALIEQFRTSVLAC
ncbi:sugar ABC transporter substrate-binding protein [Actinokineospora sp. HUAS TT18]|uniref:sugar ABC transporter substrate-binding protein n=1 Tax=Actinokineospora sp. HUAS TT18 TaxID=3447451 RepID=UPI003F51B120